MYLPTFLLKGRKANVKLTLDGDDQYISTYLNNKKKNPKRTNYFFQKQNMKISHKMGQNLSGDSRVAADTQYFM